MPRQSAKPPYSVFANFYDYVVEPLRGPNDRAREKVLGPLVRNVRSACDLCCGTGTTALELARLLAIQEKAEATLRRRSAILSEAKNLPLGPRVYAVDKSREMLRVAREKFRRAGVRVRAVQAEMRTFRLPRPVDLVTCEFDAINHLSRKQDLTAVVRAIARALSPGGWFFFDANTTRAFKELWIANWIQEGPGFFMAAHGGYDQRRDKGWTVFDWFVATQPERGAALDLRRAALKGGATIGTRGWRRFTERFEEVAWPEDEIRRALQAAGLGVTGSWDLVRFAHGVPWAKPGCRIFWLARKERA
jgi:SAM-dependent methyltransferase